MNLFKEIGYDALKDAERSGRPRKLSEKNEFMAINYIAESPISLKAVVARIGKELKVKVSVDTLKRLAKEIKLSWKRVRKSLKSRRNQKKFEQAEEEIKELMKLAKKKKIDVTYFDESGISMSPNVPYCWQAKGRENTEELPSVSRKCLNVIGFLGHDHSFSSYVFEENVTSEEVVASIDDFVEGIKKPTTLLVDNATMHTSKMFKNEIEKWEKMGLTIKFLPKYSPELNKIEILWRFIKYKWLNFDSYLSFENLKENLFEILSNIGSKYKIDFKLKK